MERDRSARLILTGGQLPVAVSEQPDGAGDRVCAALTAAGHLVSARSRSVKGLIAACDAMPPVCVVVAAGRPDGATVSALRLIRSEIAAAAVVIACERASGTEVRRGIRLGVDGVVLNDRLEDALGLVVATVCAGQVSVPGARRGDICSPALTSREKQILRLVIGGLTNGQIAARLFLAESTVKSHLSSAFGKLGVSSRNEAASLILDPDRGRGLGILSVPRERSRSPA
jgi:DNA-binding NarL/FixJ family response regulator